MLKQLDGFIGSGLSNTSLWQAQALWQEGTDTVVIGTARNSSLLKDEAESQLNLILAQQVRAKRWPSLGLLEGLRETTQASGREPTEPAVWRPRVAPGGRQTWRPRQRTNTEIIME